MSTANESFISMISLSCLSLYGDASSPSTGSLLKL